MENALRKMSIDDKYQHTITGLPKDIIEIILLYLDPLEVFKISFVCSYFNECTKQYSFWKKMCTRYLSTELTKELFASNQNCNKEVFKQLYFAFHESSILKKDHQIQLLDWLSSIGIKGKLWNLCYKGSVHGFSRQSFFENCGTKGLTLLIIKTPNGYIFGGFNESKWDNLTRPYKAFIFSLENPFHKPPTIIFPVDQGYGCARSSAHGPLWGTGYDLGLFNLYGQERIGWSRLGANYLCPYEDVNARNFFGGAPEFELEEVEVFEATSPVPSLGKLDFK